MAGAIHEFVPVHEILTEKEAKEACAKLNLKPDNLPKMLNTDPQAVRLQAKPGNIIMIKRNDQGNAYTYYRLVVEG